MTKLCLSILAVLFLASGCCALEKKSGNLLQEGIAVSSVSSQIGQVYLNNRNGFLYVGGTAFKEFGKDLNKTKVVISFLDEGGRVLDQIETSVVPARLHTNKGRTGRFSAKVHYNQDIKTCKIGIG